MKNGDSELHDTARTAKGPRSKLNDIVYSTIRDAIFSLKIRPGERINIAEIAKSLDVSITPVKSAVQRLIAESLIVEKPGNAGFYAFDMGEQSLLDIFSLRKCYEGYAAYLCAQRFALIDLDAMEQLAEDYHRLWTDYADGDTSPENNAARTEIDVAFHELLVKNADNALLFDYYSAFKTQLTYSLRRALEYWDRETDVSNRRHLARQHLTIVKAIGTGIPDMARKVAEEHVQFATMRCILNRKV